jgi:hypothetical protein
MADWIEVYQRPFDEQWLWECGLCGDRARGYATEAEAVAGADRHANECTERED